MDATVTPSLPPLTTLQAKKSARGRISAAPKHSTIEPSPSPPHLSARLLLRNSAAHISQHASRTSLINSISEMATADRSAALFPPKDVVVKEELGLLVSNGTIPSAIAAVSAPPETTSLLGEQPSHALAPPTAQQAPSDPASTEYPEGSVNGSARKSKTTYTREEKLHAIDRYHQLVECAASIKPLSMGNSTGPSKVSRHRVTIMDGARMAGVEYQTFRNWLRAEDEIRKQIPGSKNAKRGRRSLQNVSTPNSNDGDGEDTTSRLGNDEDDDMIGIPSVESAMAESPLTLLPSRAYHSNKRMLALGPNGDSSRLAKRIDSRLKVDSGENRLLRSRSSASHQSRSNGESSLESPTSSLLLPGENSGIIASSVDRFSNLAASSQIRMSRVRTSTIEDDCEIDACTITCSSVGSRQAGSNREASADIQSLSHPHFFSLADSNRSRREPTATLGSNGLASRINVVRSDVSHASIQGNVWLINCTVKNSRIVGANSDSSVSIPNSGIATPETDSSASSFRVTQKAIPQKNYFVLCNCRIENATVVGSAGAVFDGQVLKDGFFEARMD